MKKIVGILIIILLSICLLKPKEEVKLDNVILKQEVNNKTFAMYKEESENNYVKVEDNKFPDMYVLNIEKSKCIDNNGNELNGVLSYENDKVVLTTNKSSYCYLYFDKSIGLEIKEKTPNGLKIDKVRGEMYRFQGQAKDANGNELVDNYICFGTSDKDICKGDTDKYMYRIIGIEAETGRVKVNKKEALNETYQWYTDYNIDIEFPESRIYETINGTGFLQNEVYIPNLWKEKIATNTWTYGDMLSDSVKGANQKAEELYQIESGQNGTVWHAKAKEGDEGAKLAVATNSDSPNNGKEFYYIIHEIEKWTNSFDSKISLMYLHDYYYSVSDTANCQYYGLNYEICKIGWMNLSQNDTNASSEWTMTRHGWSISYGLFRGIGVSSNGYINNFSVWNALFVRPVFYINASEELLSKDATGTITDPFIIKS